MCARYRKQGTAIEWSKTFIDQIHAYHSKEGHFQVGRMTCRSDVVQGDMITDTLGGIHYYDSIIVLDKQAS